MNLVSRWGTHNLIPSSLSLPSLQEVPAIPFHTTFLERNLPSVGGLLKFIGVSTVLSAAAAAGLMAYKKGLIALPK